MKFNLLDCLMQMIDKYAQGNLSLPLEIKNFPLPSFSPLLFSPLLSRVSIDRRRRRREEEGEEEGEEGEGENTRDRSVPDGSDNNTLQLVGP